MSETVNTDPESCEMETAILDEEACNIEENAIMEAETGEI